MPIPDRPVSGASIESVWGQDIHDRTFSPAGCAVTTGSPHAVGSAWVGLNLDTVNEDPGGYLDAANTQIEIPTDRQGLYLLAANFNVQGSVDDQVIRVGFTLNGSLLSQTIVYGETGQEVNGLLSGHMVLVAGDILDFQAKRVGAPNVTATCSVSLIRVGDDYGA